MKKKSLSFSPITLPILLFGGLLGGSCQQESSAESSTAANNPIFGATSGASEATHVLKNLDIMAQDLRIMRRDYVDSHLFQEARLDKMFMGITKRLEEDVDELRLVRNEQVLYVTVGTTTKEFNIPKISKLGDLYKVMLPIAAFLDENLSKEVDRAEVEYSIINGAFSALDPHTLLLPPVQAAEMDVDNSGEFGGLGIEIYVEEGELTVRRPIEDTPASRAGLQADDKIIQIEEYSTINMDVMEAVSVLRGRVGDPVTIHVMRKGWKEPQEFTIVRGRIKIDPVKVELLSGNIAYVRIQSFNANVSDDMNAYLDDLQEKITLNGVILDLRYNPGGYLSQARYVSDKFISEGVLVSTVEGSARSEEFYRATEEGSITDVPMAVLINGNSASASEIVAGAIRNHNRGIIIGERSFGKGSVQQLHRNDDGSKLKITIAQYLTPGKRSIQSVGIPPDIALHRSIIEKEDEEELISLYWEDFVQKERDLEHHLSNEDVIDGKETYHLRYLQPEDYNANKIDPKTDWQVQFARRVIQKEGRDTRNATLSSLARLIDTEQKKEDQNILKAFSNLDRDWTSGDNPPTSKFQVRVEIKGVDSFVAGEEKEVSFVITNTSKSPLHQISLWTESDNGVMDQREVYVGRLKPGETVTKKKSIRFPYGYSAEKGEFSLIVRDQDDKELKRFDEFYIVKENERPIFGYDVTFFDDGSGESKGNGDGIPQEGEIIEVEVKLRNIGYGNAVRPFVSLKNKARKYLNLQKGNLELGVWQDAKGESCTKGSVDCYNIIQPKEEYTGRLRFEVREGFASVQDKPYMLLQIGDNYAYDYNTIRAGFSSYFRLEDRIDVLPKVSLSNLSKQQPLIRITKKPDVTSEDTISFLSGVVEDDRAIKQLMVFHNDVKIFYQGENQDITNLPFGVESKLEEGMNRFSFLAKDKEGLTTTQTVHVYKPKER